MSTKIDKELIEKIIQTKKDCDIQDQCSRCPHYKTFCYNSLDDVHLVDVIEALYDS